MSGEYAILAFCFFLLGLFLWILRVYIKYSKNDRSYRQPVEQPEIAPCLQHRSTMIAIPVDDPLYQVDGTRHSLNGRPYPLAPTHPVPEGILPNHLQSRSSIGFIISDSIPSAPAQELQTPPPSYEAAIKVFPSTEKIPHGTKM